MTDEELRAAVQREAEFLDLRRRVEAIETRKIDPRTKSLAAIGALALGACAAIGAAITTAPQAALERVADAFGCAVHGGEPAERVTRGAGDVR